jgi:predicted ArsR family transcriptional regulator
MPAHQTERTLDRLAVLADPVRRGLYLIVARSPGAVSREQAARRAHVSRALAAFHLDKLVEQGLLDASYRRLTRRRGPGAGRPAKLYRRSSLQMNVSFPPRAYELAARVFAGALATGADLAKTARDFGADLGRTARARAGTGVARRSRLRQIGVVLQQYGYEPFRAPDGAIRLHNCPFDALARDYRSLMCGTNQALLSGIVRGLGLAGCAAVLDPQPGMCCVALRTS